MFNYQECHRRNNPQIMANPQKNVEFSQMNPQKNVVFIWMNLQKNVFCTKSDNYVIA